MRTEGGAAAEVARSRGSRGRGGGCDRRRDRGRGAGPGRADGEGVVVGRVVEVGQGAAGGAADSFVRVGEGTDLGRDVTEVRRDLTEVRREVTEGRGRPYF